MAVGSCAGSLDGALLDTFEESDACVLSSGWGRELTYPSPGSYLFAFRLRGKDGYVHTIVRRMPYVPNLPLPLILSEVD